MAAYPAEHAGDRGLVGRGERLLDGHDVGRRHRHGAVTLNAQGRFPYHRLIEKFPLDRVNEAFEASHRGNVIKSVLTMPTNLAETGLGCRLSYG